MAVAEKGVLWLRIDARAEGGNSSAVRPGTEDLVRELLADLPGTTVSRTKGRNANGTAVGSPFVQHFAAAVRSLRGTEPQYAVRLPASDASRWRPRERPTSGVRTSARRVRAAAPGDGRRCATGEQLPRPAAP